MSDVLRAYSYLRCSTPEQMRGDSFRRQSEAAERYARENGLVLDDTLDLRDQGVSAYKGANREAGLGRFLSAVEDGRVPAGSFLLVENLDRISRQTLFRALGLLQEIVESGVTLVTLSDRTVYSMETLEKNMGTLMVALVVMMRAHEESALKSSRIARAWEAKRQRARDSHEAMTKRCPAWLRIEGSRYVEIQGRADTVRWLFERAIAGDGKRKILADLRSRGIAPWGRGHAWHDSYVQKILASEAAFGRFSPLKGKALPIEGYFPAVVTEDTYWRAQAARAERRTSQITVPPGKGNNIVAGLAKCACGAGMHYQDKGARSSGPYLICGSYRTGLGCVNGARWLYRDIIREIVYLTCLDSDEGLAPDQGAVTAAQDKVIGAKTRLGTASKKLASLTEAIAAGAGASLATAHAAADLEVARAKAALDTAETEARMSGPVEPNIRALYGVLTSPRHPIDDAEWRTATASTLRRLIQRYVFDVGGTVRTVYRTGVTTTFNFPEGCYRLPGQRISTSNKGWWDGGRDTEGKPTKAGSALKREGDIYMDALPPCVIP